jgi:hypothetical protein
MFLRVIIKSIQLSNFVLSKLKEMLQIIDFKLFDIIQIIDLQALRCSLVSI